MEFENGHALVIGLDQYTDSLLQNTLPSYNGVVRSAADARGAFDVLRDAKNCAYPKSNVTLLESAQKTRQGLVDALKNLATQTNEESTVLIYYCGHAGLSSGSTYHWSARDTQLAEGEFVAGTGLDETELLKINTKLHQNKSLFPFPLR